jgi:hypothetical protein
MSHRDITAYGRLALQPADVDFCIGGIRSLGHSEVVPGDASTVLVAQEAVEDRSCNKEAMISGEEMKPDGFDPVLRGGREEDFTGVSEAPSEVVSGDANTVLVAQEAVEDRSCNKEAVISGDEMKLDGCDPVLRGGRKEDFIGVSEAPASADDTHTIHYKRHTNISLGTTAPVTTNSEFWIGEDKGEFALNRDPVGALKVVSDWALFGICITKQSNLSKKFHRATDL